MKIVKFISLIALAFSLSLLSACNSDEPSGTEGEYEGVIFGDFVTLTSVDATGATMQFIPLGSNRTVTLSTDYKFNTAQFKAATRIFLNYYYLDGKEDNTVSGPVNVVTALNVDGGGAEAPVATAEDTNNWASHRITMSYIQLSGNYVNFIYTGQSVGNPTSRHFYFDESTAGQEYPEFHIIFEGNLSGSDPTAFGIRGSYNIGDVLSSKSAKGIKVIYPSSDNKLVETVLDFAKVAITPVK